MPDLVATVLDLIREQHELVGLDPGLLLGAPNLLQVAPDLLRVILDLHRADLLVSLSTRDSGGLRTRPRRDGEVGAGQEKEGDGDEKVRGRAKKLDVEDAEAVFETAGDDDGHAEDDDAHERVRVGQDMFGVPTAKSGLGSGKVRGREAKVGGCLAELGVGSSEARSMDAEVGVGLEKSGVR